MENKKNKQIYDKEYREKNKEKIKEKRKENYQKNKTKILNKNKEYITENSEKRKTYLKEYRNNNKKIRNEKYLLKINTDSIFKLKENIRKLIQISIKLKGFKKNTTTKNILGCDIKTFYQYLEYQWSLPYNLDNNGQVWMNWDNHGLYNGELNYGWDIDHKIPLASAITEDDVIKLNNYTNLQPLCSYTNRYIKRNKY